MTRHSPGYCRVCDEARAGRRRAAHVGLPGWQDAALTVLLTLLVLGVCAAALVFAWASVAF